MWVPVGNIIEKIKQSQKWRKEMKRRTHQENNKVIKCKHCENGIVVPVMKVSSKGKKKMIWACKVCFKEL
jgi:transcription elongation factor Elf1